MVAVTTFDEAVRFMARCIECPICKGALLLVCRCCNLSPAGVCRCSVASLGHPTDLGHQVSSNSDAGIWLSCRDFAEPCKDPVRPKNCAHRYCLLCFKKCFQDKQDKVCATCRTPILSVSKRGYTQAWASSPK